MTAKSISRITKCDACQKLFEPGKFWPAANYCRSMFLLPHIEVNPGLSAWELSQKSGMYYESTSRGLAKARELGLVTFT